MRTKQNVFLLWALVRTVKNWPVYIMNRYGLLTGPRTYKLRNGLSISSRSFSVDRSALNEIWLEKSYEPSGAGVKWDWKSCKTIVDIGAHIGTFSLYAAIQAPDAKIESVEPEPGNFQMLEKNVRQNGLGSRIGIFNMALGGKNGVSSLHISTQGSGGHSLYEHGSTGQKTVQVRTLTLTELFKRGDIKECDFLKMDCEGAEYDAIYSTPPDILRKIRCMALEYHHFSANPDFQPERLKKYLEQNGFGVFHLKKSVWLVLRK